MAIINFAITKPLEQQVNEVIKSKGFVSKAEFFRFAAINYINNIVAQMTDEEEFGYLTSRLNKIAGKKLASKKLQSLKKQLSQI